MAINQDLWHSACEKEFRHWPCPNCRAGIVGLVKGSIHSMETLDSKRSHDHEAWEPEWIDERFSAFLKCQSCGEVVVASGRRSVEAFEDYDQHTGEPESFHAEIYTIKNIYPSPPIFTIHKAFPEKIANELKGAFSNFWPDHSACANSIRRTIEAVMVERGMKTVTDNGKPIFLDSQITEYEKTSSDIAVLLRGIKWHGNYGSHVTDAPLSKTDLLEGFEVLEQALEQIYIKDGERIRKIAEKMTKGKGKPN
ncbi:MAG: DUF4145 domain-containing protein [Rhodobacteraceae bacterium]|nr:DUF4145 domain-containing protein [Paracoccaceae bacterium]